LSGIKNREQAVAGVWQRGGMVQPHQGLVEAVEEIAESLYGMIDMYVAVQRRALIRFPECSSAVAVALGAQLDQLEAMAREGVRALR
jgi:hypothetical protein